MAEQFDLRTHIRHPKTGVLERTNHYRLFCEGSEQFFERPKYSGNLFYMNNEPAGRIVQTKNPTTGKTRNEIKRGEPHVDYIPPATRDQVIAKQLVQKDDEIRALQAKLAALEQEQNKAEAKKVEMEVNGQKIDKAKLKSMAEAEVVASKVVDKIENSDSVEKVIEQVVAAPKAQRQSSVGVF